MVVVVVLVVVWKYLTFIHKFTIIPVTLQAALLTEFSSHIIVSFSIAWSSYGNLFKIEVVDDSTYNVYKH